MYRFEAFLWTLDTCLLNRFMSPIVTIFIDTFKAGTRSSEKSFGLSNPSQKRVPIGAKWTVTLWSAGAYWAEGSWAPHMSNNADG